MSLKQTAIIAVTATLISSGAAIGTYFLSPPAKPKNIREALIKKKVNFLNFDKEPNKQDEIWEFLILALLDPNKDNSTKIKASTVKNNIAINRSANILAIKEACTNLLDEKEVDDTKIKLAENWCTLESELLTKSSRLY